MEDVRGEIEIMLQFEKIQEKTLNLGETIKSNYQNDQNIDSLLETQNLSWNQLNGLERSDQVLPPQLVNYIFEMTVPEDDGTVIDGLMLNSGEYVVIELQAVKDGSLEDFDETELNSLESFIVQQSANADFEALITGLQNRADIIR